MHLHLQKIAQIGDADIHFGDLTVFVGPQASGKSIALQFLKLVVDIGSVQAEMRRYGLDWSGNFLEFFDAYFGEDMSMMWGPGESEVSWRGETVPLAKWIEQKPSSKAESLFFIPAQRVLTLRDGWPRPFTDYKAGDPFVVREFSEKTRVLVEQELGKTESLFPHDQRMKKEFRDMLKRSVFANWELVINKVHSQKRLELSSGLELLPHGMSGAHLPYMVWSAGQRELVPLLLGMYRLMPPTKTARRANIKWVVLEELEMGLHPRAIDVLLLMVFDLVARGYRVCLSTHSPQVLEAVWALRRLKENGGSPRALLKVFDAAETPAMIKLAQTVMAKKVAVYYFDSRSGRTKDISALDVDSEEAGDGSWGGLDEFSGRANAAVASAVANFRRRKGK
jgi:AAA domain, putative AbiEii toxin, Type IV TA system